MLENCALAPILRTFFLRETKQRVSDMGEMYSHINSCSLTTWNRYLKLLLKSIVRLTIEGLLINRDIIDWLISC